MSVVRVTFSADATPAALSLMLGEIACMQLLLCVRFGLPYLFRTHGAE